MTQDIQRRHAAATRGPWKLGNTSIPEMILGGDRRGDYVCNVQIEQIGGGSIARAMEPQRKANADFIVHSWADIAYLLDALKSAEQERDAAQRERDAWIETARMHHGNEEFYRGLVTKIGEMFGQAAYTSDDGSVQQDVLALKVSELVSTLLSERKAAEAERDAAREKVAAWMIQHTGEGK